MSRHKWKCRLHAKRYISVEVEVKAKARVIPVLNWGAPRTESKNYVCMYVCNYVVCMCACMYVNMYVCIYVCMYLCMLELCIVYVIVGINMLNPNRPRARIMYVCMYVCKYVVCMCACMYVNLYVCMYVCMYLCMYVCMYACMYVHTYRRTMASFSSLPRSPHTRVPGMVGPFWAHHAQAQDQEMKVPLYYNMIYHTIPWYTPQQILNKLIMLQTYSTIL